MDNKQFEKVMKVAFLDEHDNVVGLIDVSPSDDISSSVIIATLEKEEGNQVMNLMVKS